MLTLKQAKVGMADKIAAAVVDQFQRNSIVLDNLPFDDAVSPTGGSTLVYGYEFIKTPAKAGGRKINEEYTPQDEIDETKAVNLAILGGSFQIDRVIAASSSRRKNEVEKQLRGKVKATINEFQYCFINGDYTTSQGKQFDGLKKQLRGTDSIIDCAKLNVSGEMTRAKANILVNAIDSAILDLADKPSFIASSKKGIVAIRSAARELGYLTPAEDAFGRKVDTYDGTPIVNLGKYYNDSAEKEIIETVSSTGKTDIVIWCQGPSLVHGVSLTGSKLIDVLTPDFKDAKAVHQGMVEMVTAVVVENSRAAAILQNIQVAEPVM